MLGAKVVLILGGKPKGCIVNRYYLWSEMTIEDIQFDTENKEYILQGIENLVNEPIDLTGLEGFSEFRSKCGNFAYGLQSMKNKKFYYKIIAPLISGNKLTQSLSYNQWIDNFIVREEAIYNLNPNEG